MDVASALTLLNTVVYKPGWHIEATDHTNRFEGSVRVVLHYPARNSNRDCAPKYRDRVDTYATFAMIVSDCDDCGIYRRLLDAIICVETHEAREFLRVAPTMWAPFHPHRVDGMRRWGDPDRDLMFGIA